MKLLPDWLDFYATGLQRRPPKAMKQTRHEEMSVLAIYGRCQNDFEDHAGCQFFVSPHGNKTRWHDSVS
jgi:hypothetical protein